MCMLIYLLIHRIRGMAHLHFFVARRLAGKVDVALRLGQLMHLVHCSVRLNTNQGRMPRHTKA
jgi:hypothetical protein